MNEYPDGLYSYTRGGNYVMRVKNGKYCNYIEVGSSSYSQGTGGGSEIRGLSDYANAFKPLENPDLKIQFLASEKAGKYIAQGQLKYYKYIIRKNNVDYVVAEEIDNKVTWMPFILPIASFISDNIPVLKVRNSLLLHTIDYKTLKELVNKS